MNAARHSRYFLAEVMERPAIATLVRDTLKHLEQNPTECVVVGQKSTVQFRVGNGKRSWVSMRALVWMQTTAKTNDIDPPSFATPSCGTAGCVNPAHQVIRDLQPRIKVVRHVHASS